MAKQELIDGGAAGAKADADGTVRAEQRAEQTTAAAPHRAPAAPALKKRRIRAPQVVLLLIAAGALGFGAKFAYGYWTVGRFLESTDDAYVSADITTLSAKVSAYVKAVPVVANQKVKAGDVLVQLDDGDLALALRSANAKLASDNATIDRIAKQILAADASVASARAQVTSAEADLAQAKLTLSRQSALITSSATAQANVDSAATARDKAAAALTAAHAGVDAALANVDVLKAEKVEAEQSLAEDQAARDQAARNLSFSVIRAPMDGVIGNMAVQVGDYVVPGQRLAALVPLSEVRIDANFKETQIGELKPGQKATFTLDAYPGKTFEGTVEGLSPATGSVFSLLPPQNATGNFTKVVQRLPVRISIPKSLTDEGFIRPGLSAVVTVDPRTK